ncbi:MAG: GMC oxidoreductase [Bryobacteraceae bacterium]
MADRCAELLHAAGATEVVKPAIVPESPHGISTHQLGRCRMGHDAASSMTDRTGRMHGVPNVYIADGSLLVNPGGANRSLTLQALAFWVSRHILSA